MAKLKIIRGLPGSGKSTLAKQLGKDGWVHVEADMFFMHPDGSYQFDGRKLGEAHDWCHKKAAQALEMGLDVVVSNTFSRIWEMAPYIEMARKLNAEVSITQCHGAYQNVHNVPEDAVERMRRRWESHEGLI